MPFDAKGNWVQATAPQSMDSIMGNYGTTAPQIPLGNAYAFDSSALADHLPAGDLMAGSGGAGGWGSGLSGVGDFFKNSGFLGKTENGVTTQGWGGMAFGGLQALGNTFMGMKQYGLAKDQLAQSKKQFDLNYGAQQKTTNAALSDRQNARVASNPGAYQSVADYMKKNGI